MNTFNINNWAVQWTTASNGNLSQSIALFSCPSINSNIVYSYTDIMVALHDNDYSAVPKHVFETALDALYLLEEETNIAA